MPTEDLAHESEARHVTADLKDGDLAAARFRENHPDLSEKAIQALAWCYTFDYK